jgi:hypothetical protein
VTNQTVTFRPAPTTPGFEFDTQLITAAPPGYEILGKLGQGGMGTVYRARQITLNRMVAIKVISAGRAATRDELARFKTEAEALARLKHPHIVQVHDFGEYQGLPYLCLEYVDGGSLGDRFDGKPLEVRAAAELVETLARALDAAHRLGIVHRDLKPANVLVSADGQPKVTDFGIAKHLGEDRDWTRTGAVLGTPGYMAPEQAIGQSKDVSPAADVFALGALLYQALTGEPPFRGSSAFDALRQTLEREPQRPSARNPLVDRDLETICLKCLAKQAERRYASASMLAEDLRRWLSGVPIRARRTGRLERTAKWLRGQRLVSAAIGFLLVGLLLTIFNLYFVQRNLRLDELLDNAPPQIRPYWLTILFFLVLTGVALSWYLTKLLGRSHSSQVGWFRMGRWRLWLVVLLLALSLSLLVIWIWVLWFARTLK